MSHVRAALLIVLFMLALSSGAFAQVVYAPVQYQYFSGGQSYYYGGSDPAVHYCANLLSQELNFGRTQEYAFHSGNIMVHREVVTEPTRVFSDTMPGLNARFYGYTIDDARNAAYANAPTYFRKADIAKVARVQADGTWVVPSTTAMPASMSAGTIEIKPYRAMARPAAEPKPILIIPKRLLDKPLWPSRDPVADARQ